MRKLALSITFLFLLIFQSNAYALFYDIVDIAHRGGTGKLNINELGNIAGNTSNLEEGNNRAFFWDGTVHDIYTPQGGMTISYGFNDLNQIVGVARGDYSNIYSFIYDGTFQALNVGRLDQFAPHDINNQGVVVGAGVDQFYHSDRRAYKLENGVATDLGTFRDDSVAYAINESGQIVGTTTTTGTPVSRPFIYENGSMNLLSGGYAAVDINESGSVLHERNVTGVINFSINDLGQVVGSYNDKALLSGNDLNDYISSASGWDLVEANDINNKGQIVGWGYYQDEQRIFLLNPISETCNTVPEPATMLLLASGLVGVFLRKRNV